MVVALILARLLAPEDWGLAAMVLVFSGFAIVFTDSALGTALIQRRTIVEEDRSTVFWTSAAIGVVLMLVGIGLSGPARALLRRAGGRPALRGAVGQLPRDRARDDAAGAARPRDAAFAGSSSDRSPRRSSARPSASRSRSRASGRGRSSRSSSSRRSCRPCSSGTSRSGGPRATFSFASLRRLGGFAGNVFGENLLYQAGRNVGNLLIGRFLGASALGHVRARDEHRPRPVLAHRRTAPAGLLPGVLAHGRRPAADGRHVDSRDAPRRRDLDPCARRPRRSSRRTSWTSSSGRSGSTRRRSSRSSRSSGSSSRSRRSAARSSWRSGARTGSSASRPCGSWRASRRSPSASAGASSASRPATRSRRVLVEPVRTYIAARALGTSPWRLRRRAQRRRAGRRSHGGVPARRPLGARRGGRAVGRTPRDPRRRGRRRVRRVLPLARSRGVVRDQERRRRPAAADAGRAGADRCSARAGLTDRLGRAGANCSNGCGRRRHRVRTIGSCSKTP